jgi:hypothetical protein
LGRWVWFVKDLGLPPFANDAHAYAVSPDGNLNVGYALVGSLGSGGELYAVIYDNTHGARWLQPVLTQNATLANALAGWTLRTANAVTADQNFVYMAGSAKDKADDFQAWWLRIPKSMVE